MWQIRDSLEQIIPDFFPLYLDTVKNKLLKIFLNVFIYFIFLYLICNKITL